MAPMVRAACLTNYDAVARSAGLNPVAMLLDVALSPRVLRSPDWMIPVDKVGRLLENSARQSGNESFGLCMASTRLLSNLGPVGLLIRDQETLRDALHLLVRHLTVLNGALALSVEESGAVAVIRGHLLAGGTGEPTRQRVELALGVIVRAIRQVIGHDWRPLQVCFEHSAPRDLTMHHRLLGQALRFDQDFNGIICSQADLDRRNELADPAMVRYAQQLLEATAPGGHDDMVELVRRAVVLLMPSGCCGIEQVAEHLGVAPRTVQRRLLAGGQTISGVVNHIRRELAIRYVNESRVSLTEVAALLGFQATSSFSRWYRAQFGHSAQQARASMLAA